MWWSHDSGWAWMTVMMVTFWAFAAVAVVWVVRSSRNRPVGGGSVSPAQSPQDILAERYARGEIDSGEYRQRLEDIEKHTRR